MSPVYTAKQKKVTALSGAHPDMLENKKTNFNANLKKEFSSSLAQKDTP